MYTALNDVRLKAAQPPDIFRKHFLGSLSTIRFQKNAYTCTKKKFKMESYIIAGLEEARVEQEEQIMPHLYGKIRVAATDTSHPIILPQLTAAYGNSGTRFTCLLTRIITWSLFLYFYKKKDKISLYIAIKCRRQV